MSRIKRYLLNGALQCAVVQRHSRWLKLVTIDSQKIDKISTKIDKISNSLYFHGRVPKFLPVVGNWVTHWATECKSDVIFDRKLNVVHVVHAQWKFNKRGFTYVVSAKIFFPFIANWVYSTESISDIIFQAGSRNIVDFVYVRTVKIAETALFVL